MVLDSFYDNGYIVLLEGSFLTSDQEWSIWHGGITQIWRQIEIGEIWGPSTQRFLEDLGHFQTCILRCLCVDFSREIEDFFLHRKPLDADSGNQRNQRFHASLESILLQYDESLDFAIGYWLDLL